MITRLSSKCEPRAPATALRQPPRPARRRGRSRRRRASQRARRARARGDLRGRVDELRDDRAAAAQPGLLERERQPRRVERHAVERAADRREVHPPSRRSTHAGLSVTDGTPLIIAGPTVEPDGSTSVTVTTTSAIAKRSGRAAVAPRRRRARDGVGSTTFACSTSSRPPASAFREGGVALRKSASPALRNSTAAMYTHVEADPRVEPPTKLERLLARAWLLRKTIGGVALVDAALRAFSRRYGRVGAVSGDGRRRRRVAPHKRAGARRLGRRGGSARRANARVAQAGASRAAGDLVAGALARTRRHWPCMWGEEFTGARAERVDARGQPGRLALNRAVCASSPTRGGGTACAATRPTTAAATSRSRRALLATRPSCEVHIFAAARDGVANASTLVEEHHDGSSWFTPAQASRVHLHRATVSEVDDPGARPPKRTLAGLMREQATRTSTCSRSTSAAWSGRSRAPPARASSHCRASAISWKSAHTARATAAADYVRLFNYLEAAGLRLFAKEASLSQKGRVDLAFVQARWSPEGNDGAAAEAATAARGGGGARRRRRRREEPPRAEEVEAEDRLVIYRRASLRQHGGRLRPTCRRRSRPRPRPQPAAASRGGRCPRARRRCGRRLRRGRVGPRSAARAAPSRPPSSGCTRC